MSAKHNNNHSIRLSFKQYLLALIVWTVIILILLLLPSSSFSRPARFIHIPHADKIVHSILFFVLSFLFFNTIYSFKFTNLKNNNSKIYRKISSNLYLFSILVISSFGLMTEILQGLMYNTAKRSFSLWDWAFDTMASILAIVFLYFYNKRNNNLNN